MSIPFIIASHTQLDVEEEEEEDDVDYVPTYYVWPIIINIIHDRAAGAVVVDGVSMSGLFLLLQRIRKAPDKIVLHTARRQRQRRRRQEIDWANWLSRSSQQ